MKKWMIFLTVVCLMTVVFATELFSEMDSNVELTDEQKQEMATLHNEAMNQKVEIINKYVEYGVYSKEKASKMIEHVEAKYDQLEKNGYIPNLERKTHHSKHES